MCQMMMFLRKLDFKNAIKMNHIHNCPIAVNNINAAEDIFGKCIFALKGKMTGCSPFAVTIDTTEIPPEIVKLHNNIFLGIDIFCVNGMTFFITVSSKN